jgi:hypothetical protein
VLSVSIDPAKLLPYVTQTLNNMDLVRALAAKGGLPGAEEIFSAQFNRLFAIGDYKVDFYLYHTLFFSFSFFFFQFYLVSCPLQDLTKAGRGAGGVRIAGQRPAHAEHHGALRRAADHPGTAATSPAVLRRPPREGQAQQGTPHVLHTSFVHCDILSSFPLAVSRATLGSLGRL